MGEKRILCIGLVCLDIISVVERYPEEDTDTRCISQRWQRGGNASNSCTVLSLLGAPCAFMGSLAPGYIADKSFCTRLLTNVAVEIPVTPFDKFLDRAGYRGAISYLYDGIMSVLMSAMKQEVFGSFALESLTSYGIDVEHVVCHPGSSFPIAVVIGNLSSGSRTILNMNSFIMSDFSRRNIEASSVSWQTWGDTPCACCLVNISNGSRTVTLYDTNLPDVTVDDFKKVDLTQYKWIHWEGRNANEQLKMIQRVNEYNKSCPIDQQITTSVEIEKEREELFKLFQYGEVVFVSKDVAKHFGYTSSAEAVVGLYPRVKKGAYLVCAWAEQGADALGPDGQVLHSPAFPPEKIVDTLGAGDTFNASVIYALSKGQTMEEAITFACRIAGKKCGVQGYDGIVS